MDTYTDPLAYQVGQIIGALMMLGLGILVLVGLVVSVVKAFRTRKKGWIVAASLFSLPVFGLFALLAIGFVMGFLSAMNNAPGKNRISAPPSAKADQPSLGNAAGREEAYHLLNDPMQSVSGINFDYTLALPGISKWKMQTEVDSFDYIFSYRGLHVGVIAERIGMVDVLSLREAVVQNLAEKSKDATFTDPRRVQINGREWMAFDVKAVVNKFILQYRFYLYTDENFSVQLIAWSSPSLFEQNKPLMEKIAASFQLPNVQTPKP